MQTFISTHPTEPLTFPDFEQAAALLGPSKAVSELYLQVRRLAPHLRSVLLAGFQDCGQESVAQLLQMFSGHPYRSFVTLKSSEAEQYFSGVTAAGELSSTFLFLQDADRLSIAAQEFLVKLMKRPQSNKVTVAAATTEDPRTLVGMRVYSPEFAAALGEARIVLPALKDRREDLPILLSHVMQIRCRARGQSTPQVSKAFLQAAMAHEWPGNFAELSRVVDHVLDCETSKAVLDFAVWKRAMKAVRSSGRPAFPVEQLDLATVMRQHVCAVLQACEGNKVRAAKVLGVSRSKLYRFMEESRKHGSLQLVR